MQTHPAHILGAAPLFLLIISTAHAQEFGFHYGHYVGQHVREKQYGDQRFRGRFHEVGFSFDYRRTIKCLFVRFGEGDLFETDKGSPFQPGAFLRTRFSTTAVGFRWILETQGEFSIFVAPGMMTVFNTYNSLRGTELSQGTRKYVSNITDTPVSLLSFDGSMGFALTLWYASYPRRFLQLRLAIHYETELMNRLVAIWAKADHYATYSIFGGLVLLYVF